mgnify:CR=1 FL=1
MMHSPALGDEIDLSGYIPKLPSATKDNLLQRFKSLADYQSNQTAFQKKVKTLAQNFSRLPALQQRLKQAKLL